MKSIRLTWPVALIALLVVACGGPGPTEPTAMFSDADLEAAETLSVARQVTLPQGDASATLSAPLIIRDDLTAGGPRATLSLDSNRKGRGGVDDLGGYVAYVRQDGAFYSIHLVDLDDEDSPESDGERVVYRGRRPIESVSVNRAGTRMAFIAQSHAGDNDVFLLDTERGRIQRTRTPDVNETHMSMALDGISVAWQGGTPDAPSIVWYHVFAGGLEITPEVWEALYGAPLHATQPSLAGNGTSITFYETSGGLAQLIGQPAVGSLAVLDLVLDEWDVTALDLGVLYLSTDLSWPSLSYAGDRVLFYEVFNGTPFLSMIDLEAQVLIDLLAGTELEHPYLTADGDHVALGFGGDVWAGPIDGAILPLTSDPDTVDSASYWARGNFTSYAGTNTQGTFVRPGGDGLTDEQRTVGFHAFEFKPITSDFYAIESVQDYDGYLLLYEGSFDPSAPEANLLATNDDWQGPFDEETGVGTSRIVAELAKGAKYVVVTSACGAPGSPCGPSEGFFRNLIVDGATPPPPPTELPPPDDSKFNITLRFWDDSLSDAEKAVFQLAADRWAEVISGDLEDIEGFVLTETQVTAGAPGLFGTLDDVIIDAAKVPIDGANGTLARAGAVWIRDGGASDGLPIYGIMEFDEAEFGPGGFFEDIDAFAETIMHEMGHVLGISRAFWIPRDFISGNPPDTSVCSDVADPDFNDPRYEGPQGNDAWANFYGAGAGEKVPIANTNGCGTADSHWREVYLQDELMTGFASGSGEPLSRVTIGALEDLGYVVDYAAADDWSIPPLPTLAQVSPNPQQYQVEFDFGIPYTNSLLGEAEAEVTAVDLQLGLGNTSTSGCEPEDFDGFPVGNIALVQRGTCAFGVKAQNALDHGAAAILIGNQGDTEDRMLPPNGTFGDAPIAIIGVPISYELMVELSETDGVVVAVDTDTSDNRAALSPQALPLVQWRLAEDLVPIQGAIDRDGNVTRFGD